MKKLFTWFYKLLIEKGVSKKFTYDITHPPKEDRSLKTLKNKQSELAMVFTASCELFVGYNYVYKQN